MKLPKVFEMNILIDLQMWSAKAFDMGLMNLSVSDDVHSLLVDLASPIILRPLTPMRLAITIGQWTSERETLLGSDGLDLPKRITYCSMWSSLFRGGCRTAVELDNILFEHC